MDLILPTFDDRVVPEQIEPIRGRAGRYGKRGTLKDQLLVLLHEAAAPLSTAELSLQLRQRFELDFATGSALKRWNDNVLRAQLRRLASEGVIEREHISSTHGDDAYWRMAQVNPQSLDELRQIADA